MHETPAMVRRGSASAWRCAACRPSNCQRNSAASFALLAQHAECLSQRIPSGVGKESAGADWGLGTAGRR
jgi:hypothetical protein